jgi:hypothetical protein
MRRVDGWCTQLDLKPESRVLQKNVVEVLESFPKVFVEQLSLPPIREQVHRINLWPDHGPVNVRPYKYPHHQKTEIERQVGELLHAGVIRPSASAFSSPVILVKKKDNTWRMCVDYRALKKPLSLTSIQFLLLMSCWMNYMDLLSSQKLISSQGITR